MDCSQFFSHCVTVNKTEDGYCFPIRFTQKQLQRYSKINFTPYSRCPAGVSLDFLIKGSNRRITFPYRIVKNRYEKFGDGVFDICENGILCGSVNLKKESGVFEYTLKSEGEVRVAVFLPLHIELEIGDISVDATAYKPEYKHKMLIIGDSVTQGLFAEHPSLAVIPRLCDFFDSDYLNCSVGGDFLDPMTIDTENGCKPDTVVVCLGTNDMCFIGDMEKIRSSAERFFTKLTQSYPLAKINIISPTWETENSPIRRQDLSYMMELYNDIIDCMRELSEYYCLNYIDGRELVAHNSEMFFDEVHPNDIGFSIMAQNLCRKIKLGKL